MKILLSIIFVVVFSSVGFGQDQKPFDKGWRFITITTNEKDKLVKVCAYKISSFTELSPNTYKFWVKCFDMDSKEFEQSSIGIKLKERQFRFFQIIYYDKTGKPQKTIDFSDDIFRDIPPDTYGDEIINTACKYTNLPNLPDKQ